MIGGIACGVVLLVVLIVIAIILTVYCRKLKKDAQK